ncbi:hypothetical protein ACH4Y0_34540 [Streptomyces sp. NPDC020707]|uniref:hypothetical protein n=1 Tax=Streptomyces sp. NPDC020707 TaxID=3365084 RepID=UPI0037B1C4C2
MAIDIRLGAVEDLPVTIDDLSLAVREEPRPRKDRDGTVGCRVPGRAPDTGFSLQRVCWAAASS